MFCGCLWAPVFEKHESILNKLSKRVTVTGYSVYRFDDSATYTQCIIDVYASDDVSPDKVRNIKLKALQPYPKQFVHFTFILKDAAYRTKPKTGTRISTIVERLKREVREVHKGGVSGYVHDIIIHMSDNPEQAAMINDCLSARNVQKIAECMNLKTLLRHQFHQRDFTRVDVLVRKYAIQKYREDRCYDFKLYTRMQDRRRQLRTHNAATFKKLIDTVWAQGLDRNCPIPVNNLNRIWDGSHRLALYYEAQCTFVPIVRTTNHRNVRTFNYGYDWFERNFTPEELGVIRREQIALEQFLQD